VRELLGSSLSLPKPTSRHPENQFLNTILKHENSLKKRVTSLVRFPFGHILILRHIKMHPIINPERLGFFIDYKSKDESSANDFLCPHKRPIGIVRYFRFY
jgi:hypothetical protein